MKNKLNVKKKKKKEHGNSVYQREERMSEKQTLKA